MTASRVLSGSGSVSKHAITAVRKAADELGYVPNAIARSLRQNRTGMIALIISDIENSFYAGIAKSAETLLAQSGFRLFIGNSDEDPKKELQLLQSVLEIRAEALIITPTAHNGKRLRELALGGTSVVQLDRATELSACSSVLLENEAAASATIEHLVSMGHNSIAFIAGPRELTTGDERVRGALNAAARIAPRINVEIIQASSYLHSHAADAVKTALSSSATAFVAGNNVVAEACMEVFAERAIQVPEDISLVTFDDLPWMRWLPAPLTSIRQPVEDMTAAAVALLHESLCASDTTPAHLRFPATLVSRDSVSAAATKRTAG